MTGYWFFCDDDAGDADDDVNVVTNQNMFASHRQWVSLGSGFSLGFFPRRHHEYGVRCRGILQDPASQVDSSTF